MFCCYVEHSTFESIWFEFFQLSEAINIGAVFLEMVYNYISKSRFIVMEDLRLFLRHYFVPLEEAVIGIAISESYEVAF